MMRDIQYVKFHNPVHIGGKNFGDKIDARQNDLRDVVMQEDTETGRLHVTWNKQTQEIPIASNVAQLLPGKRKESEPVTQINQATQSPNKTVTAQVSTPQSHVHAGQGHGQTGQTRK